MALVLLARANEVPMRWSVIQPNFLATSLKSLNLKAKRVSEELVRSGENPFFWSSRAAKIMRILCSKQSSKI